MPMPRIDIYWRNRVRELAEQNPRLSSRRIAARLEEEAAALERTDSPSEKSVRTIMAEHRKASPEERRSFSGVHWPESFGTPELPWEAAPAVLDLVRLTEGTRPTVRVARWFWRLTLAGLADNSPEERAMWALLAAECEFSDGTDGVWRSIEQRLLQPESDSIEEALKPYLDAVRSAANRRMLSKDYMLRIIRAFTAMKEALENKRAGQLQREEEASE